jgi:hypothetical protein
MPHDLPALLAQRQRRRQAQWVDVAAEVHVAMADCRSCATGPGPPSRSPPLVAACDLQQQQQQQQQQSWQCVKHQQDVLTLQLGRVCR